FYNFPQTPLVRGLDTVWIKKQEGNEKMNTPAEPLKDIHMPNGSIFPFVMTLGLVIAGFGAMFRLESTWGFPVVIVGIALVFLAMALRSVRDDHGFYVPKHLIAEDQQKYEEGGHR